MFVVTAALYTLCKLYTLYTVQIVHKIEKDGQGFSVLVNILTTFTISTHNNVYSSQLTDRVL